MSRSQGPFTEVEPDFRSDEERANAPTQKLSRQELSGDAQAIIRDVEQSLYASTHRPTDNPSSNLEAYRDREAGALLKEVKDRKRWMDFSMAHHGEFNYEDRLTSPSVHVHRPDLWSPAMQERFRGIVEYLYENDRIRFPLDPTMDDIQRHKYQKIIDEVCAKVDDDYKPLPIGGEDEDEQIAA